MANDWCVYEHVFPNGKKYIGITSDPQKRWRDGKGYDSQGKIANAIRHYGWKNVKHNIIVEGVKREQATALERYLIAELNTIDNGYNTAAGGDSIHEYYLDDYLLSMLRYADKKWKRLHPIMFSDGEISIHDFVSQGKTDCGRAEWANQAARDVTRKHRRYSVTDEDDVWEFWFYMREYLILSLMVEQGTDVTGWKEKRPEERAAETLFRKGDTDGK